MYIQSLRRHCSQKMQVKDNIYVALVLLFLSAFIEIADCQFSNPIPFVRSSPPLNSPTNYDEYVDVQTKLGHVIGKTIYLIDGPNRSPYERLTSQLYSPPNTWRRPNNHYKNVSIFLGIPYARPPQRDDALRFQLPQQISNWGTLLADKYRPSCPQPNKYTGIERSIPITDEDCLYLNIFTPYAKPRSHTLFPVIMHIHGGKFEHGSGNTFPGHMLAASQEVVVVTFNYRLGVLGFMATADNSSAGNYGLADQVAAIEWVRDHIQDFNGNPQMITLWGTGSGAASAGLLAMSPRSSHLIKRVIAQSGSASADWALQKNPLFIRNTSITIGEHFGCFTRDSYQLIKCLESRGFHEFTKMEVESDVGWLPFTPVTDFKTRHRDIALVPNTPDQFFQSNSLQFNDGFAYMSGLTRDEGSAWLIDDEEANVRRYRVDDEFFRRKLTSFIKVFNVTINQQAFIDALYFMYSPWNDRGNLSNYRQGLIDLYSDAWVVAGHDKIMKQMILKGVPTYGYVLNYTIEGFVQPEPWTGVAHDTEYFLVSGAPFMEPKFYPSIYNMKDARWTEMDRNMSQLFMEAYANFAKYGNPTPYSLFNNILWQPAQMENLQYLSVNTTNFTTIMMRDYKLKGAQFWNDYLYSILQHEPVYWTSAFSPVEMELRAYKASTYVTIIFAIILMFLSIMCSCLYCHATRKKYSDDAIDYMPVPNEAGVLIYGPPSKRVNSQKATKLPLSVQNQLNNQQTRPMKFPPEAYARPHDDRGVLEKTMTDKHTLV